MQFELTHQDILTAFTNYVAQKGLPTDNMTVVIKTSRKPPQTSRAIINVGQAMVGAENPAQLTLDLPTPTPAEPVEEPVPNTSVPKSLFS